MSAACFHHGHAAVLRQPAVFSTLLGTDRYLPCSSDRNRQDEVDIPRSGDRLDQVRSAHRDHPADGRGGGIAIATNSLESPRCLSLDRATIDMKPASRFIPSAFALPAGNVREYSPAVAGVISTASYESGTTAAWSKEIRDFQAVRDSASSVHPLMVRSTRLSPCEPAPKFAQNERPTDDVRGSAVGC